MEPYMKKKPLLKIFTLVALAASILFFHTTFTQNAVQNDDMTVYSAPAESLELTVTKNGNPLEFIPITHSQDRGEEITLLNTTFPASADFRHKMDDYIWVRAQLSTPHGVTFVGVALYTMKPKQEIKLMYLAVVPEYRRNGIGKALIDYVARMTHCKKMTLYALTSSLPFYYALEFEGPDETYLQKTFV